MDKFSLAINDHKILSVFGILLALFAWVLFFLSLSGYFYVWVIIFAAVFLTFAAAWYLITKKIIQNISKELPLVFIFSVLLAVFFSFFTSPTIFSGRDQGSISQAAIRLAQNHRLEFSTPASNTFFKIYGQGKALNFPGFYYDENGYLITQFPLVYISWLAGFYAIFGLNGFVVANIILLVLFLTSFYVLLRIFSKSPTLSGFFFLLTATSFLVFWFFKFTLSENITLAFLWLAIAQTVLFLKSREKIFYYACLLAFGLLIFSRIEGFIFFFLGIASIFIFFKDGGFSNKEHPKMILVPIFLFLAVFSFNASKNFYFYKEIAKSLLKIPQKLEISASPSLLDSFFQRLEIFWIYGLVGILILGIIWIIYLLKNKKYPELLPFFIVFPTFFYLIDSQISPDHPWMLRRFVFSVFPALAFYAFLLLNHLLKKKKIFYLAILSLILIIFNIRPLYSYLLFSENETLLEQTKTLSNNFSDKDLILIDRLASGDNWAMISDPMSSLFHKNAVYFFNPNDLEKIDTGNFEKIYLIVPQKNMNFYTDSTIGSRIEYVKNYSIVTQQLDISNQDQNIFLPPGKAVRIEGTIFKIKK